MSTLKFETEKDRPLWTLSLSQFTELLEKILAQPKTQNQVEQAIGLAALARALCCSTSQLAKLRRDGVLDDAIISRIGRRIVFDVDKARVAANKWHAEMKKNNW